VEVDSLLQRASWLGETPLALAGAADPAPSFVLNEPGVRSVREVVLVPSR
jgi:hypothetical protein